MAESRADLIEPVKPLLCDLGFAADLQAALDDHGQSGALAVVGIHRAVAAPSLQRAAAQRAAAEASRDDYQKRLADAGFGPIRLGPALMVYLDALNRRAFLTEWENAMEQR